MTPGDIRANSQHSYELRFDFSSGPLKDELQSLPVEAAVLAAASHELSALGATVVLASRKIEKCDSVRDEIIEDGGKAFSKACNIRNEEDIKNLIETVSEHGQLDFLVNNAGGQFASPIDNISVRGWAAVIETNLTGTFLLCREAVANIWVITVERSSILSRYVVRNADEPFRSGKSWGC